MNNNMQNPSNFDQAWADFKGTEWKDKVDVRDFIQNNYTPYLGDDSFLAAPTDRTKQVWAELSELLAKERACPGGVLDVADNVGSRIDAFGPGYINKDLEKIVGVQTDAPLKRGIFPNSGFRLVATSLEEIGRTLNPEIEDIYTHYRKDHNQGTFDIYDSVIRACRSSGVITGLPDAYGRGRIIGDYRRVALYGVDFLIRAKEAEKNETDSWEFNEETLRLREELSEQTRAFNELKSMAMSYGFDISHPAETAQEAIQWTYFAYLAATKEQNGAAMSFGRVSTFLDIYIERDLKAGKITENEAQELIDDLVIKLRIIRFLRTEDYNQLFSGDPTWVTESIGGMGKDGRTLVSKNSFRFLHLSQT